MLEKLRIRNFQTHTKFDLELAPGVNTVIGPTDAGKSALFRALKLVCLNRPLGDSFITYGQDATKVSLYFDGGKKVTRTRGKGINLYTLGKSEFSAFGNDVPDTVKEALGIGPLNFQNQHDSSYWFGESDGDVAKKLNAIVNLGEIDDTLTRLSGAVRTAKAEYDVRVKNVSELRKQKKETESAVELSEAVSLLEALDEKRRTIGNDAAALHAMIETVETSAEVITHHSEFLKDVGVVVSAHKELSEALEQEVALGALLERLNAPEVVVPDISGITLARKEWKGIYEQQLALDALLETLRDNYRARKAANTALELARTELENNTPDKCPLCGQSMKGHTHE